MNYTERVKALREDNDKNQTQIAKVLHVAQTTYSDYEKGKVRMPVESLIELAKLYNVDMNYITGVSNKKQCFPTE
ncbi:MAG: helix-turn-helix transcriptional regulator [Lachnospiraceae bacterium]|nr:helix-turn-helix transcriptional regulator [Lachnospiraceae bacterium]